LVRSREDYYLFLSVRLCSLWFLLLLLFSRFVWLLIFWFLLSPLLFLGFCLQCSHLWSHYEL
jgi:hypothetical protein